MSFRNKRGRPKDPPTVAIEKANELIKNKKNENAFSVLFETISYRHRAQFDQTYEEAMTLYIDVGVSILKSCKEGFLHYRSLVQQNHPQSLQKMISHLVLRVEEAGAAEIAALGGLDCELQYESKTLKYQWDSYQTVLMILRNNGKLNHVYKGLVLGCIKFCKELNRSTEFKKLNETIRRRFGYVINNQSFDYALKINSSETLNSMFETRLAILECSLDMGLHQESFKTIKDIQKNIINRSYELKKNLNPLLYARFYKALSSVFWHSNRHLLHAYAIYESYKKLKIYIEQRLSKKERTDYDYSSGLYAVLIESLIAALVIVDNKQNNNKDMTHSLHQLANDFFSLSHSHSPKMRPNKYSLLGVIIAEINSYSEADFDNAKDLYDLVIINTFSPLTFTQSLLRLISKLECENGISMISTLYKAKLYEMGVIVLLFQLSKCYKSISWSRFKQLCDYPTQEMSDIALERIITFGIYYGNICCQLCHSSQSITFNNDSNSFESEIFVNNIIELNDAFVEILQHSVGDTSHNRESVFAQISLNLPFEHEHIQKRLRVIESRQRLERRAAQDKIAQQRMAEKQQRLAKEKHKQTEQSKIEKEKKEITKSIAVRKNQNENRTALTKKWNKIISQKTTEPKKKPFRKAKEKKLEKISYAENVLKRQIEKEINKKMEKGAKDAGSNQLISKQILKLEKIQKKKERKILQIERIEFDHLVRAQRKYLLSHKINKAIEQRNSSNLRERKQLFKQENKENKEKYFRQIEVRNRLREIRAKHIRTFINNVKEIQSQKANYAKKPKIKKPQPPKPTNNKSEHKHVTKPAAKQVKRQATKPIKPTKPTPKQATKPKAKTFAEKMRQKRDGTNGGGGSAFGDRFSQRGNGRFGQ